MQTFIREDLLATPSGQEANRILRSCVHCGFCTATCPTYRLLGDELDSPRGRIYLIKGLLEGREATSKTRLHLDRCLTCRACETYCPSGVEYGHLLDIGRRHIESEVRRSLLDRLQRFLLRKILTTRVIFTLLLRCGQSVRPLLPRKLKRMIPSPVTTGQLKHTGNGRKVINRRRIILVQGCVQPVLAPQTNLAAARILDRLGFDVIEVSGETCCGALDYHLAEQTAAVKFIKRNIDHWWPYVDNGVEAIVSTASGCGVMIKDYGYILRDDPAYAARAARVADLTRDISEIFTAVEIDRLRTLLGGKQTRTVFQNPCTLQHGQKLKNSTEDLLKQLGFNLCAEQENYLCCGSAGTYSLLQRKLSQQLRDNKIKNLMVEHPDIILTANIGCQLHLQQATDLPVQHWIELVADSLQA